MNSVETTIAPGRLQGRRETVCCFRGVPFAAAAQRFMRPTPCPPWGTRVADTAAPAPIQLPVRGFGMRGASESSEDCLYLNVFTPACDAAERPVLFWIFGGGFAYGDAADALFDGQQLAFEQDVVVVSANYRLGAFGFLAHGDSNLGLRDQLYALEWVQAHIRAFGGDPGRVTVFGESSGAMSLCNLLTSPASRGLFRAAIAQSGAADNVGSPDQARRAAEVFFQHCATDDPPAKLLKAFAATNQIVGPEIRRAPFRPYLDDDVLPVDPEKAAADGNAVPLVIGITRDEQRLYVSPLTRISNAELDAEVERSLQPFSAAPDRAAGKVIDYYRTSLTDENRNAAIRAAVETELRFRQPMLRLARSRGGNTWLYRFNWPSPALRGWLKACHAIEIPFVFGNLDTARKFVGRGGEPLSRGMRDLWGAVAHTGRPPESWPEAPALLEIHPDFQVSTGNEADAMWDDIINAT